MENRSDASPPSSRRMTGSTPDTAMLIVNSDRLDGYRITEYLGIVRGNTVRAKHIGRDVFAGLKSIVGGELKGYTELLTESRNQSMQRMEAHARSLGADAVINVRMVTSQVMEGSSELLVYGTAVRIEKVHPRH